MSFITVSRVRKLRDVLQQITSQGAENTALARQQPSRLRILTTTFTGATEARALDDPARHWGAILRRRRGWGRHAHRFLPGGRANVRLSDLLHDQALELEDVYRSATGQARSGWTALQRDAGLDTIIATRCIEDGLTLLHTDRDFLPFVEHFGLKAAAGYV